MFFSKVRLPYPSNSKFPTPSYHTTQNALSQNFLLVVLRSRGYLSVVDNGVVHFQSVPHLKWAGDFWEFLVTWEFYKQVRIRRKIYKMAVVDSFKNERFLAGS